MKKIGIFLIIATVVVSVSIYLMLLPEAHPMTDSEKQQAVSKILGRQANLTDKKPEGNTEYKDDYLSFSYPAAAAEYKYRDPGFASTKGLVSSFSYDLHDPRVVFNYSAVSNPSVNSLDDDPSYRLREDPSRGYRMSKITIDNVPATLFQQDNSQNSEATLFIFYNKTLFTFATTGPDSAALTSIITLLRSSLVFN